ncbi:MutL protein [Hujiaoplasma nucleasis]|uniref:MutL protein n=1 Tax=Hujiaoplasma nucleasis TaxID=2725268 RepID=A0A7L6N5J1_9MOLU|nr:methylaspartate mutase accessory protein GlmL [Hujiaoplasma nucleasis]QLY40537.1 MutL protein [Hujiaoplasma nucleasis]
MSNYLLVDFGSTFTKLCAVDIDNEKIIGTSAHYTTVLEDISIGYHNALNLLYDKLGKKIEFEQVIACSSAAGGLKMAAIGLVEELTVEAAKRVCLGAGAKVDLVFSHHLTRSDIKKIKEDNIDIILLSGGADGGNRENVIYNAQLLGEAGVDIPIIYAGNKSAEDNIIDIFDKYHLDGYICDNVMPKINKLNPKCARNKIRELFLKKIIEAKGIKKIESDIDKVILPTPNAVLQAAELLSEGYLEEKGLGDLVLVDIGGATTDLYSMCFATNRSDVVLHGLEEPYAKRTVEGDLGMRYSAPGIVKSLSQREIEFINREKKIDIIKEVNERYQNVHKLPHDERDAFIDQFLAEMCAYRAMHRHVGKIHEVMTPMGKVFNQTGKDLTNVSYLIGTGGVIINSLNQKDILRQMTNILNDSSQLRPEHPEYLVDQQYILAPMGLLSQTHPKLALKLMKENLKELR